MPKIDTTISIRDIISLVAVLITGIIAFQLVTSRVEALEKSDQRQDEALKSLTATLSTTYDKVTEMGVDIRYLRREREAEKRAEASP